MSKKKKTLYIILLIVYALNFVLSLLNYIKTKETLNLIALILWGVALILEVIALLLESKKK